MTYTYTRSDWQRPMLCVKCGAHIPVAIHTLQNGHCNACNLNRAQMVPVVLPWQMELIGMLKQPPAWIKWLLFLTVLALLVMLVERVALMMYFSGQQPYTIVDP